MLLLSFRGLAGATLALVVSTPAAAQYPYGRPQAPAAGETYTVEVGVFLWKPTPDILIQTESLTIVGTPIDLAEDLGVARRNLPEFRFVLHPARKHKLRVSLVPIHYSADTVLERTFVFNGTIYRAGLPVTSDFEWNAWRFGYEYDFVSRDRGYVGVIIEAKYTDVKLDIASSDLREVVDTRVPIPAIGGTFRVYPASHLSLTGEVTGMTLPGSLTEGDDTADYLDWDLYATVSFTRNVAAQVGYRTLDLSYRHNEEFGDFKVKGVYVGGVVRF